MSWRHSVIGCVGFLAALACGSMTGAPAAGAEASSRPSSVRFFDPLPDGADIGPGAVNPRTPRSEWTGRAAEFLGTTDRRVPCISDGADGSRIEVLYAHPSDYSNWFATYRGPIQMLVANINREVLASAGETKGLRQLRLVTEGCQIAVRNVTLGLSSASTDFDAIAADLDSQGYGSASRLYLVYLDGKVSSFGQVACGVAGGFSSTYAMMSDTCWADVDDHELVHALGAVHFNAPHASGDGHCTDKHDILCGDYAEAPNIVTYACPWWHHDLLDCGHDDYFSTNPPAGSFLRLNPASNTANSPFLTRTKLPVNDLFARALPVRTGVIWGANVAATAEAGEPATAGSAPAHSIWFKIATRAGRALGIETYGSSVDTVLGVYRGTSPGALSFVAQNDNAVAAVKYSRVYIPNTRAATYFIRVDGKNGAVGSVRLNVADGDLIPKITSFTPASAIATPPNPTRVTLHGTNLLGSPASSTTPTFNGTHTGAVDSGDTAYGIDPSPVSVAGPVTLSTPSGFVATDGSVRIVPQIVGFEPASGPPGTAVEVHGTGFISAAIPKFAIGTTAAPLDSVYWDFHPSDGLVGFVATLRIPSAAATGRVRVKTSIGAAASAATFTVTP